MLSPGRKTGEKIEFQEYRKTSSREVKLCMYYQFAFSLTPEATLPQETMPAILLTAFSYKSHLYRKEMFVWCWNEEFKGRERNTQNNQWIWGWFCFYGGLHLSEGKAIARILCWWELAGSGPFAWGWHLCLSIKLIPGQVRVLLEVPVVYGQSSSLHESVFLLPSYWFCLFLFLFICSSDTVPCDPVCLLSSMQRSH